MWSSTSIIVPSHSVSSALMLLLLQFHNQGVRMLMPMSFNLMCTPINLLLCFQGNRMIRAAKTGNVEEVRKCLDSGTNVNYSNVIIFYMIIDVFAWKLYEDQVFLCNDDICYLKWIIVLFRVFWWCNYCWYYLHIRVWDIDHTYELSSSATSSCCN